MSVRLAAMMSSGHNASMWSCQQCTFRNESESAFCEVCYHDPHQQPRSGVIVLLSDEDDNEAENVDGNDGDKDDRKRPARKYDHGRKSTEVIELLDNDDGPRNGQKKKKKTATTVPTRRQQRRNGLVMDLTNDSVNVASEVAAFAFTPMMIQTPLFQRTLRQIRREQREIRRQQQQDEALARALQVMEDDDNKRVARQPEATYDVLHWHRQNIHEMLKTQAAGISFVAIDENPHAKVGTTLYNRFVEAWQLVQDQTVELAFHGTAEVNVDAICQYGLDPTKRAGQALGPGEYFAKHATVSIPYSKGGKKMLVVAVLVDRTGLTADQNSVLVIHKPEHQLPLFVITMA